MMFIMFYSSPSSALVLSGGQSTLIGDLDTNLELAFLDGVLDNNSIQIVPPIQDYPTLASQYHQSVRDPFDSIAAAFIRTMNIPGILPNTFSGTATLPKLTTNNGSLDISQGLITVYNPPS
jgi:hypothetical protein